MRKLLYFIISVVLITTSISTPTSAITDPRFFSSNNILFYDDECLPESGISAVLLAGNDNTEKILNFFMRKGLNLAQAAGIVGNIMQESGLKPDIEQGGKTVDSDYIPKNGVGFGLVQWTFTDRQAPLVKHVKDMGVPITDLGGQLSFIWEELNGGYLSTLNKLRSTDDPVEAAVIFHDGYERSADTPSQVKSVRGGNSQKVYDQYKDAPALAGSSAEDELRNPGGDPDDSPEAGRSLGKVYVLGDSITEGAASVYDKRMRESGASDVMVSYSGGGNLDNAGTTGTRRSGLDSIKADKDYIEKADTIVIAHGTNNMSHTRSADVVIKETVEAIKNTGTNGSIYWVDVAITNKGPSNYMPIARDVNKSIYRNKESGYQTVSWSKTVDPNYDPVSSSDPVKHNSQLIAGDGIHLTSEGNEKLVESVINTIKNGGNGDDRSKTDCNTTGFAGGNFNETLKHYAWSEWKGLDTKPRQEYKDAFTKAKSNGLYIGGLKHPGIDCGGFVTLLVRDSGFDKDYNYGGKGGPTSSQQKWASENWETLGSSASIDPASLQPGDVAINNGHTFIFVGDVPGFEANIASASLDERAPMADPQQKATQPGFTWFRKK
ncbi:SGNH/GDSL hydrolase family protein [Candidatus Saccharibacteria bacterium]|jgi:lysophospholipase L1-like esterase|nr:SGNH/GDSL hydrolase family protein [Candidatus Saccharibacteria bacterium]